MPKKIKINFLSLILLFLIDEIIIVKMNFNNMMKKKILKKINQCTYLNEMKFENNNEITITFFFENSILK